MGQVTIAEANKLVKKWNSEVQQLYSQENRRRVYLRSESNPNAAHIPDYDFNETREQISALTKNIAVLKHDVNKFNVTTRLKQAGLTIDEALVKMSFLTKEKDTLEEMQTIEADTINNTYGSTTSVVHKIANFSMNAVTKRYKEVMAELTALQLELDYVNSTEQIHTEAV